MRWLIAGLSLLVIASCNVQKRDITNLDKLFVQYPSESARLSNWLYPCFKGKAKSDTVLVAGFPDTVLKKGDTVTIVRHDTVKTTITRTIQITKPVTKIIHDTLPDLRQVTVYEDQVKDGRDSVVKYRTQYQDKAKSQKTWMWIAIAGWGLILIFAISKIVLIFTKV